MTQANTGFFKPKLQLSNGYPLNFTSLAHVLQVICQDNRGRIPREDLATITGFAERHVKQICSLAHALGLIEQITYKPTPLGRIIQLHDPFFDDKGTLWFLHYAIGSNSHNLVWNRMVTSILPTYKSITKEQARDAFNDLSQTVTEYSSQRHVLRELNTVLDAYINQQFAQIAYLLHDENTYILNSGIVDIPPLVLAACIACFLHRYHNNETTITTEELFSDPNGPGVVLQITETSLRYLLEQLKMQPDISLENRADLDQVRLTEQTRDYMWMERYYVSR